MVIVQFLVELSSIDFINLVNHKTSSVIFIPIVMLWVNLSPITIASNGKNITLRAASHQLFCKRLGAEESRSTLIVLDKLEQ